MRWVALLLVSVCACVEHGRGPDIQRVDGGSDGASPATCPQGNETKIKFTQSEACGNDGSVEFCIPSTDVVLKSQLMAISPKIACAPGGGRAGCNRAPSLLLCSYPTAFPDQCTSSHGAMTDNAWRDMCSIAGFPQIAEIVPTILE